MKFGKLIFALLLTIIPFCNTAKAYNAYDQAVLNDKPVLYLTMNSPRLGTQSDLSQHGLNGKYSYPYPGATKLPNGDTAAAFNGLNQFLTVLDAETLSIPTTGILTIDAWMRSDTLQFSKQEGAGYVYWLGKGQDYGASGQQEYAARMYSLTNAESRPNRISAYVFNPSGGLGAGSYFQDSIKLGQWIHVTAVFNTVNKSSAYPTGYVKIYRDASLRDQDSLSDYNIVPKNGSAPLRMGTMTMDSFFQGGIGKVAIYNYELTLTETHGRYHSKLEFQDISTIQRVQSKNTLKISSSRSKKRCRKAV